MAKQIVGTFKTDFSGIEFYDIVDNYKEFTILRHQLTRKYYTWHNRLSLFSDDLHIIDIPKEKEKDKYEDILDMGKNRWCCDMVFFWADSKFVTDYGLPGYDRLIELFKTLIGIRHQDMEIGQVLGEAREHSLFNYYLCKFNVWRMSAPKRRMLNKVEKEFKVIW